MAGEGERLQDQTRTALLEAEDDLLEAHPDLVDDPLYEVEGLDRAACAGHITTLSTLAVAASAQGVSSQQWRTLILDALGERRTPVLNAAEGCMRANGLWPWPD